MNPTGPIDCLLCRCHGEIDGVVDVQRLRRQLEDDSRVRSVTICDAFCLDGHVAALAERMRHDQGQHVLIAACSPFARGDELVARLGEQGIDAGRLLVTDIREGCAWIHAAHPAAATAKAMDIVRTGVARLRHRERSADLDIRVTPRVMVIGGRSRRNVGRHRIRPRRHGRGPGGGQPGGWRYAQPALNGGAG